MLLGAFSYLTHDGVLGARLVPFLIGLLVVLTPLIISQSVAASILILVSPFFYAASSHLQTDPTVGILGYLLLCVYWFGAKEKRYSSLLYFSSLILWTGKLEILIIGMSSSFLLGFFEKNKRDFFKHYILANLIGFIAFVGLCWGLGSTAGYTFKESVFEVIGTIARITGDLKGQGTFRLISYLNSYDGIITIAFLLFPILCNFKFYFKTPTSRKIFYSMGLLFMAPLLIYLKGGYAGDGFPRYLLIVFLPLCLLASHFSFQKNIFNFLYILIAVICFTPKFYSLWSEQGSITVGRGTVGTSTAANIVRSFTKSGDLVLGVERMLWYGRDRRWLTAERFEAYPDLHQQAYTFVPHLAAAIIEKNAIEGPAKHFFKYTTKDLLQRGFVSKEIGSYLVFIRP